MPLKNYFCASQPSLRMPFEASSSHSICQLRHWRVHNVLIGQIKSGHQVGIKDGGTSPFPAQKKSSFGETDVAGAADVFWR